MWNKIIFSVRNLKTKIKQLSFVFYQVYTRFLSGI